MGIDGGWADDSAKSMQRSITMASHVAKFVGGTKPEGEMEFVRCLLHRFQHAGTLKPVMALL